MMRSSISDALSTREPPVEDSVETAPGALSVDEDTIRRKATSVPGVKTAGSAVKQTRSTMKKLGTKTRSVGVASARKAVGSESIDAHRKTISQQMDAATEADADSDFLTEAYQNREFDVGEAADRGILAESERPAEGVSTVTPDPDGNVTYTTAEGEEAMININDRAQNFDKKAHTFRENASKSARSVTRIRTAQAAVKAPSQAAISTGRAGKRVGNVGVQVGKASGVVFAGAMTRSPYAAYQIGKRGGKHLIGPGSNPQSDNPSDVDDIDWSTHRVGPGQATNSAGEDDSRGEASEKI
jgi:type IV secretion system protein TrbL